MERLLIEHTPGPTIPVAPVVLGGRRSLRGATDLLLTVDDARLEQPWPWRGDTDGEADVRYGYYRAYEALERAAVDAGRALDEAGVSRPPSSRIVAPATAARWDLHGVLVALTDADLDRDPGGGEWTIRQTLAHVVNAQRAYGWFTAWWLDRPTTADFPPSVPDEIAPDFPDEAVEGAGTLEEVRARLDETMDLAAGRLGSLDDTGLAARARWSGFGVDVAFRLGRWASHIREHTVQVDKTLVMLGVTPREVERLVRLVHSAWGRLEAEVFALPTAEVERAGAGAIVSAAAGELEVLAGEVAATAANAGAPGSPALTKAEDA